MEFIRQYADKDESTADSMDEEQVCTLTKSNVEFINDFFIEQSTSVFAALLELQTRYKKILLHSLTAIILQNLMLKLKIINLVFNNKLN